MSGKKKVTLELDTSQNNPNMSSDTSHNDLHVNLDTVKNQDIKLKPRQNEKKKSLKKELQKPQMATMERFIKRREQEPCIDVGMKKDEDEFEDVKCKDDPHKLDDPVHKLGESNIKKSSSQDSSQTTVKPRKKKAKFAFNTCDMNQDNTPILSDDENIIMQLNIHPSREEKQLNDTCFAQETLHECVQKRIHLHGHDFSNKNDDMKRSTSDFLSGEVGHDKRETLNERHQDELFPTHTSPSPYDIFENDFYKNDFEGSGHNNELVSLNMNLSNTSRSQNQKKHEQDENEIDNEESQDFKVVKLLKDFEDKNKHKEWPISTNISCYWCCHKFFNAPFGIPVKYNDEKFHVFGCFCSLECGLAYNLSMKDQIDEMWERCNLLNFLCRKTNYNKHGYVKPAPPRLSLKMFGGYLSIEEFRNFSNKNRVLNINFPPMQTITQQIEEINESDINNDFKYIPIDTDRINKYKEKMRLRRTKPLNDTRNTLDSAVNIKITTMNT